MYVSFDASLRHRPERDEPGNCAQGSQVLDRLVSRAFFAVTHRIMGEDEKRWELHDRGKPYRRPRIINEDEESGAEAAQLGDRHLRSRLAHGVLAIP